MKEKLKIGIMLNEYQVPAWIYSIIEELNNSDYAEIALVIKNKPKATASTLSKVKKLVNKRDRILHNIHLKIDEFLFREKENCFASKNSKELLRRVFALEVSPKETKFIDRISEEDINKIKAFDLDIVLRFGFRILKGNILNTARYGVWSYHHGDNTVNRGGPPGYWEVMEKWPETGYILQILNEKLDAGKVLYRSWSPTNFYSVSKNKNNFYWRASLFVPRIVKGLHKQGEGYLNDLIKKNNPSFDFYDRALYKAPTTFVSLKHIIIQTTIIIRRSIQRMFFKDYWSIYYKVGSHDIDKLSFRQFKNLDSGKSSFWADPFVVKRKNSFYLFVEEYLYKTGKGHISVIKLDEKGNFESVSEVLNKPYHLSYPFVFTVNGEDYMIPETKENQTIELYKCIEFPNKWRFERNLMEGVNAVDSTIFFHEGLWWLFTSIDETGGKSSQNELFLFYSEDPLSDSWNNHPLNPVVSDVKTARPAGRVFTKDSKIYRPSQDSSGMYGGAFNLNQILVLNKLEYKEVNTVKVRPKWNSKLKGTHTFNFDKNITVIDAYRLRSKL